MPRPPNREAKTLRLVLIPKTGQEPNIRAFKELCARNNLQISDVLYSKVEDFLKEHHWPPGNSQTILTPLLPKTGQEKFLECRDKGFYKHLPFCAKKKRRVGENYGECANCRIKE